MSEPTLTEFLLARIAEDEAEAFDIDPTWPPRRMLAECEAKRRIVEGFAQAERLVEANAEKHAGASQGGLDNQAQITALRTHGWELSGRRDGLRFAVDEIAAVYSDHPDYDESWRP